VNLKDDLLTKKQKSGNTPYLLFVTRYSPEGPEHYIFCESNDDIGFYDMVARRGDYPTPTRFFPCDGKTGVFAVKTRLSADKYDRGRLSFIVDADHDRYLQWRPEWDETVFVTDFYSVESYLISVTCFIGCLQQHSGIQTSDPIIELARSWYIEAFQSFSQIMQEPMATVIALRRLYGADAIHLDGIAMHTYVRYQFPNTQELAPLSPALAELVEGADEVAIDAAVKVLDKDIQSRDARAWVRGKFLSWWFSTVFNGIANELRRAHSDQNGKPFRCGLQMSPKHFIPLLLPQLQVPPRLHQFFSRRLSAV
jgi:hypothetical protein